MEKFLRNLCFLILVTSHWVYSQSPTAFCRVGETHDSLMVQLPSYQKLFVKKRKEWGDWVENIKHKRSNNLNNITIPVVFHDLYSGTPGPILNYQQLVDKLNLQFSGQNPSGQAQGVDTQIQFCLKNIDAMGQSYTGLTTQHHSNISTLNPSDIQQLTYLNGLINSFSFPKQKVCNVFIIDDFSVNGMQGFSFLPYAYGQIYDGVYIKRSALLSNDPNDSKILTHEMGHYLGLYHIFGRCNYDVSAANAQNCFCGNNSANTNTSSYNPNYDGDMIADTPAQFPHLSISYSCSDALHTCNDPNITDLLNNYMDFGIGDCMTSFTPGQIQMMHFILDSDLGVRNELNTGTCCSPFDAYSFQITPSPQVLFTSDLTNGNYSISTSFNDASQSGVSSNLIQWTLNFMSGSTPQSITTGTGNITLPSNLVVGHYQIVLAVHLGIACNYTKTFSFTVLPPADCPPAGINLSMDGSTQTVSYKNGWSVNANLSYVYPNVQRNVFGSTNFDANGFQVYTSTANINDSNLPETEGTTHPQGKVIRVGRVINSLNSTNNPNTILIDGAAYYTTIKLNITPSHSKYRIYYKGVTNQKANGNVPSANINRNLNSETTFGWVVKYKMPNPFKTISPSAPDFIELNMDENGNDLNNSSPNYRQIYSQNDLVFKIGSGGNSGTIASNLMSNININNIEYTKTVGWQFKDVDFTEVINTLGLQETEVTITLFARSNDALTAKSHSYAYFSIDCLGGGYPSEISDTYDEMQSTFQPCTIESDGCYRIGVPRPQYILPYGFMIPNAGVVQAYVIDRNWLVANQYINNAQFVSYKVELSTNNGQTYNQINVQTELNYNGSNFKNYVLKFCPPSISNGNYFDLRITFYTWRGSVIKNIRVFRGFNTTSDFGASCQNVTEPGGKVLAPNKVVVLCPNDPLPKLTLTDPCFPSPNDNVQNGTNYNYQWWMATSNPNAPWLVNNQNSAEAQLQEPFTSNQQNSIYFIRNQFETTLYRTAEANNIHCPEIKQKVKSEMFTVYSIQALKSDIKTTINDICISEQVRLNIDNFKLKIPSNLLNFLLSQNAANGTIIDLWNSNPQNVQFELMYNNQTLAQSTLIDLKPNQVLSQMQYSGVGLSTQLMFDNMSFSNNNAHFVFPNNGTYTLQVVVHYNLMGCNFTDTKDVVLHVVNSSFGGQIDLAQFNCQIPSVSVSTNDLTVFTSQNTYRWEYLSNNTWLPLGAPSSPTLNNFDLSALQLPMPVKIRRVAVGNSICPVDIPSNTITLQAETMTFSSSQVCINQSMNFPITSVLGVWTDANTTNVTVPNTSVSGNQLYTFTPSNIYCNAPAPWNLTVLNNQQVTYSASDLGMLSNALCLNAQSVLLPNTVQGVTGAWAPSPNIITSQTGSQTYTFTASIGTCYIGTYTVQIQNSLIPNFGLISTICSNAPTPNLPPTDLQGITGSWSPPTISLNGDADYVFYPQSGQCASTFTQHISIIQDCQITINYPSLGCQVFTPGTPPGPKPDDPGSSNSGIEPTTTIQVCENTSTQFDLLPSPDLYTNIHWTVAGGAVDNPSATSAIVQWGNSGTGHIRLDGNFNGQPFHRDWNVSILPIPTAEISVIPTPDANSGITEGCTNSDIYFTAQVNAQGGNQIFYYSWDFGDGHSASGAEVSHQYVNEGTYVIKLTITNGCGCSNTRETIIHISKGNFDLGCINPVCDGGTGTYTIINADNGCNAPNWFVQGGTLLSAQGPSNTATILWNQYNSSGYGVINLTSPSCGTCVKSFQVPIIKAQGTISGNYSLCVNKQGIYSLPLWPSTKYNWHIENTGGNASLFNTNSPNEIAITGNNIGSVHLTCEYVNTLLGCTGTASMIINITPQLFFSGPTEVCTQQNYTYTINSPISENGPISAHWVVYGNNFYQDGQGGTISINFPIAGNYTFSIQDVNQCDALSFVVHAAQLPTLTQQIEGNKSSICPGAVYTYSCPEIDGFEPIWTVTGGSILGPNNTASIQVVFNSAVPADNMYHVAVRYSNNLCNSSDIVVDIPKINPVFNYAVPAITCSNNYSEITLNISDANLSSPNNVVMADAYEWSMFVLSNGSVTSGQGTNNVHVLWNDIPDGNPMVRTKTKICGVEYSSSTPVHVVQKPTLTLQAITNAQCENDQITIQANITPQAVGVGQHAYVQIGNEIYSGNPFTLVMHSDNNNLFELDAQAYSDQCLHPSDVTHFSVACYKTPKVSYNVSWLMPNGLICPTDIIATETTGQNGTWQWLNASTQSVVSTTNTLYPAQSGTGLFHALFTTDHGCTNTWISPDDDYVVSENGCPTSGPIDPNPGNIACDELCLGVNQYNGCGSVTLYPDYCSLFDEYLWSFESNNLSVVLTVLPNNGMQVSYNHPIMLEGNLNGKLGDCYKTVPFTAVIPYIAKLNYQVICPTPTAPNQYQLQVQNVSEVLSGIALQRVEASIDGIQWFTLNQANNSYTFAQLAAGGSVQLQLRIQGGGYPMCYDQKTIQLPLINPDFNPTNYTPTTHVLCGNRAVAFTPVESQGDNKFSWRVSSTFARNLQYAPELELLNNDQIIQRVTLTITDVNGCTWSKEKTIQVDKINIKSELNFIPPLVCEGTNATLISMPKLNYDVPDVFSFYYLDTNSVPLSNQQSSNSLILSAPNPGRYLVHTFKDGCIETFNDSKVLQTLKGPQAPEIVGPDSLCIEDSITANGHYSLLQPAANMQYQWGLSNTDGQSWSWSPASSSTTADFSFIPNNGAYVVGVRAVRMVNNAPCPGPSQTLHVQLVDQAYGSLSYTTQITQCEPYSAQVQLSGDLDGAVQWSNGLTGSSAQFDHDGPVSITRSRGACTRTDSFNLPTNLGPMLAYFPDQSCLHLCTPMVQSPYIAGYPQTVDAYQWTMDGVPVQSGTQSTVPGMPLQLGVHDYTLQLQSSICTQTLAFNNVQLDECAQCDTVKLAEPGPVVTCIAVGDHILYQLTLSLTNTGTTPVQLMLQSGQGFVCNNNSPVLLNAGQGAEVTYIIDPTDNSSWTAHDQTLIWSVSGIDINCIFPLNINFKTESCSPITSCPLEILQVEPRCTSLSDGSVLYNWVLQVQLSGDTPATWQLHTPNGVVLSPSVLTLYPGTQQVVLQAQLAAGASVYEGFGVEYSLYGAGVLYCNGGFSLIKSTLCSGCDDGCALKIEKTKIMCTASPNGGGYAVQMLFNSLPDPVQIALYPAAPFDTYAGYTFNLNPGQTLHSFQWACPANFQGGEVACSVLVWVGDKFCCFTTTLAFPQPCPTAQLCKAYIKEAQVICVNDKYPNVYYKIIGYLTDYQAGQSLTLYSASGNWVSMTPNFDSSGHFYTNFYPNGLLPNGPFTFQYTLTDSDGQVCYGSYTIDKMPGCKPKFPPIDRIKAPDTTAWLRAVPNPSEAATMLQWQLSEGQAQTLTVLDARGLVVARMALTPGVNAWPLDTQAWASGVYTLRLDTNTNSKLYCKLLVQ